MFKYAKLLIPILIFSLLVVVIFLPLNQTPNYVQKSVEQEISGKTIDREWLIKWNGKYQKEILSQSELVEWNDSFKLMKIKLKKDIVVRKWLQYWRSNPNVEYIQPNYTYQISQINSKIPAKIDEKKYYIKQINAEKVLDEVSTNEITIAILDTGIDLMHPDLKPFLTTGINLLDKSKSPQDDNGHGTNVAGIVTAISNSTIAGRNAPSKLKIMPVKVLDKNGEGDSFLVGQGIRYAVDNGAKIVLLSLGEPIFTPFMNQAINYAEAKGVLVIAASGNKGDRLNYPSAFPNVFSVGAVDKTDSHAIYSNYGQQLDSVAPGDDIYTTKLNGGYTINSGTSMAAPQVATLAALLFQKHPYLSPKQISDLIKFTADDVEYLGWDNITGYGRINVKNALTAPLTVLNDGYEPNQTMETAHIFPLGDTFIAQLDNLKDTDWYKLELSYPGKVKLDIKLDRELENGIHLEIIAPNQIDHEVITKTIKKESTVYFDLPKGTSYIKLDYGPEQLNSEKKKIKYVINNQFNIYGDPSEDNDKPWFAAEINNISNTIVGTISKKYDEDWYKIDLNKNGVLTVNIFVDTVRLDPILSLQSLTGKEETFDFNGSGKEEFGFINVSPGTYFIKVTDYNAFPINGEYRMELSFKTNDDDTNEPNDLSIKATELKPNEKVIEGAIFDQTDYDWFKLEVEEPVYITMNYMSTKNSETSFMNENLDVIWNKQAYSWNEEGELEPGIYYLRFSSRVMDTKYVLNINRVELVSNYIDIADHWARDIIVKYSEENLINGYDNYTFQPDKPITRAEVAYAISRVLELSDVKGINYIDVNETDWFYSEVAKAINAGIIVGFKDQTFKPNNEIKRDELVVILSRAFDLPATGETMPEFADVKETDFGYHEINTFSRLGLIAGYEDNSFRPKETISRANFLVLLDNVINYKQNLIER